MEGSFGIIIVASLFFSALFSGLEIAFVSASKLKIELDRKQGSFAGRINSFFLNNQSRFITTLLLGNNIALVVYGIYMAMILEPQIYTWISTNDAVVLLVQTILSTLLILVTAEFLPKTIFRIDPNRTLNIFSVPAVVLYFLLYPLVAIVIWLSEILLQKAFKTTIVGDTVAFGKVDLDDYVKEAAENRDDEEALDNEIHIFQNVLDFSKVKARECMVPRNEIQAVDIEGSIEDLTKIFSETGLSKVMVYRESIDNIIGYVHSFELFKNPDEVKKILLPVNIVPESMPASKVLEALIKSKRSVSVVVDEFGGTAGLITMEDVVEEIFGEIEDEHDEEEETDKELGNGKYLLSARMEIDHINEKYKESLPVSDEYETLAGLIIHINESIPEVGEEVQVDDYRLVVKAVSGNKIEQVLLYAPQPEN